MAVAAKDRKARSAAYGTSFRAGSGFPRRQGQSALVVVVVLAIALVGLVFTTPSPNSSPEAGASSGLTIATVTPPSIGCNNVNTVASLSIVSPASDSGVQGSEYQVDGSGFYTIGDVLMYAANATGSPYAVLAEVSTGGTGAFSAYFAPKTGLGQNAFWAVDDAGDCAYALYNGTAVPPTDITCLNEVDASLEVESPSPASGAPGSSVTLGGSGWATEGDVAVYWAAPSGSSPENLGFAPAAFPGGVLSINLNVPASGYGAGVYFFWATDTYGDCAAAEFTLTGSGPTLTFSPSSGPVGTPVTLTGTGFGFYAGATVGPVEFENGISPPPAFCPGLAVGADGTFSCPFAIPASGAGAYSAYVTGLGQQSTNTFTVTPSVTLFPTSGIIGSTAFLNGSGFTETYGVAPVFDSMYELCTNAVGGVVYVAANGTFSCSITVPIVAIGSYPVGAHTEIDGTVAAPTEFDVIVAPTISVVPAYGPPGSSFTVTGSGFSPFPATAEVEMAPNFGTTYLSPTGGTDCATNAGDFEITLDPSGDFVCTFTVPQDATPGVTVQIVGNDSVTQLSTSPVDFEISVDLLFSVTSGPVGTPVTVTGEGFQGFGGDPTGGISFMSDPYFPFCSSLAVGSDGSFSCSFDIPQVPAGVYSADVTNFALVSDNTFTVTPSLTVSPTEGIVGSSTTLSGQGFTAGDGVVPGFDSTFYACEEGVGGVVYVAADGTFTCTLTIPPAAAGDYLVTAHTSADGTIAAPTPFEVIIQPTISISPSSGAAGSTYTITGAGFSPPPSAAWVEQVAYSVVLTPTGGSDCDQESNGDLISPDSGGGFVCTFTVPANAAPGTTIELVAQDGATGDWSNPVYFAIPQTVTITAPASLTGPVGASVKVSGAGWIPGDGFFLQFSFISNTVGEYGSSCATSPVISKAGTFTCVLTVPQAASPGTYWVEVIDTKEYPEELAYSGNMFTVLAPAVRISSPASLQGPVGGSVTLKGTGFDTADASSLMFFLFQYSPAVYIEVSCANTLTISAAGGFTCQFSVPSTTAPGGYYVQVLGSDPSVSVIAEQPYTVMSPALTFTRPASLEGPVGGTVTVQGTFFDPSETTGMTFYFSQVQPGAPDLEISCSSPLTITSAGTFNCQFTVPATAAQVAGYYVFVTGGSPAVYAQTSNTYTVLSSALTITAPSSLRVAPGGTVTVKGTGFDPNDATALVFSLVPSSQAEPTLSVGCSNSFTISSAGSFSCKLTVPATAAPSIYAVLVYDEVLDEWTESGNTFSLT